MTLDEAIIHAEEVANSKCDKCGAEHRQLAEWLKDYKRLLEQEPILDKIRTEIENIAFDWQEIDGEHESFMVVDLNDALQIIDKYKAESEEV